MSKNLLKCAHFTLQGLEDAKISRTQTGIEKDYLDYLENYSICERLWNISNDFGLKQLVSELTRGE